MGVLHPAMLPADIEELAWEYLKLKMAVAMGTKLPRTPENKTKPDPYLRLEFGGGTKANLLEYDLDTILHSYAPDDGLASLNGRTATGYMASAQGETVDGWFVSGVPTVVLPRKVDDPRFGTSLSRYRSMVTWRVQAQPL